ncbi:MAG TPA: hypothetical protein VFS43_12985 [Polyangiaceae bacterium]|nr:hypothetical protein [Polyangiaceae bacterium]
MAFAAALGGAAAACSSDDDDGADDAGPTGVEPGDPRYERDPSLDVELESRREGRASHEAGSNCMQCHQRYGPGPGQFSVAGTAYGDDGSPRPDATVRLLDAAGAVVIALEADALGNFYSTAALPLPDVELFPRVESADARAANAMPFGTLSGACNVCHTAALPVVLRPVP